LSRAAYLIVLVIWMRFQPSEDVSKKPPKKKDVHIINVIARLAARERQANTNAAVVESKSGSARLRKDGVSVYS